MIRVVTECSNQNVKNLDKTPLDRQLTDLFGVLASWEVFLCFIFV